MPYLLLFVMLNSFFLSFDALAVDKISLRNGFDRALDVQPFKVIRARYGYRPEYLVMIDNEKGYYGLSGDGRGVAFYSLENTPPVGWPLTRWSHLKVPPEISFAPGMFQMDEIRFDSRMQGIACMVKNPLRYGDLEGDGEKELILILGNELIVFSPTYGGTVFSMLIDGSDWWPWGNESLIDGYKGDHSGQEPPISDQYHGYSHNWADWSYEGQFEPGIRAYSKLYTGDFDDDGNPDIIKWEKVYKSNKLTESPPWTKVRNTLIHYERDITAQKITEAGVTGEYLPQITPDVLIEGWLRANDLTWQKGFPSLSECEGQEGQLIPEMHDPLLNDEDVLH